MRRSCLLVPSSGARQEWLTGFRFLRSRAPSRFGEAGEGATGVEKSAPESRHEARAKLLAQNPRAHLLDLALGQFAELKRAERHADQARDREAEIAEHVAHLAVLALADRKGEPDVRALHAIESGFDGAVADAADGDAGAQGVELLLRHRAMRAHAIAAQPAGCRQFEYARERAVVGQEQQAFGVEVEPADADEARQVFGQALEDGRPALRVGMRRHQPARLVVEEQPRALARSAGARRPRSLGRGR